MAEEMRDRRQYIEGKGGNRRSRSVDEVGMVEIVTRVAQAWFRVALGICFTEWSPIC